jgi:hypothetical protein
MALKFCRAGNCAAFCIEGCGCIASSNDPDDCVCICDEWTINVDKLKWLDIDTMIDFCFHDLRIESLALFIDAVVPGYVAIPPKSADSRITMAKKGVPCRELLVDCGLLVIDPTP